MDIQKIYVPDVEVKTHWSSSDIREMCIRNKWYTAGDNNDYSAMLEYVDSHAPEKKHIYRVAKDIFDHSSNADLYVEAIMFVIANEVVRTFYKNGIDLAAFEEKYYEAYQLDWMLSHGWALKDAYELIVGLVAENVDENPGEVPTKGEDIWLHAERAREAFEYETGFGSGSMFACKEEFLGAEFRDRDYMEHLFTVTHAPEKDRVLWYREVCGEGIPNPEDPYADALEKLIEVLKAEGPEAIKAFIRDDVPETEEGIRRAILKVYSDMPEDVFLNTLKEHGIRQWFVSFAIDGRYCAEVWAKDQGEAEEEAKTCYYDADFGELECVDSIIDHVEDDQDHYLDPLD